MGNFFLWGASAFSLYFYLRCGVCGVHLCVHVHICVWLCMWWPEVNAGYLSTLYTLRRGLHLNPELTDLTSLAIQLVQGPPVLISLVLGIRGDTNLRQAL